MSRFVGFGAATVVQVKTGTPLKLNSMTMTWGRLATFVLVAAVLSSATSARVGDEQFREEECGLFYVFAEKAIHVVDASTMDVVKTIDTDMDGNPLETPDGDALGWGDVVYMEDAASGRYLIFANTRNELPAEDGTTQSDVIVVDTVAQEILDRVVVGGRPIHLYGIFELNEMWTHPDAEGTFDVIRVDDPGQLHAEGIPALVEVGGHGKLASDPGLGNIAYATNTEEPYLYEIDLVAKEMVATYSWTELNEECVGGHAISYSDLNKHVYVEAVGCGSILEFDSVNKEWVHSWANVSGALYQTPEDDLVVVVSFFNNRATIMAPQATGERSTVAYTLNVPGNPGVAAFFPKATVAEGEHELEDHLVFFPTARNTLKANIEAVEALGDGRAVTDSGYNSAPFDCEYDDDGKLALNENGEPITPNCGSCAREGATADDYDYSLSGFAWVDMADVIAAAASGEEVTAQLLPNAGAMMMGFPSTGSNECAYGFTYRTSMRGGRYICTNADLPESSICCIDASTQEVVGCVPTSDRPARIAYAPLRMGVGSATCPAVEEDETAGAGRKLLL